jgi:DNA repair exonuclease SbcCD nuclease subunit
LKVALITDQHFGARNDSSTFLDFYEKFYSETFFPKLIEENIKTVLILGDTFDRRKYINFYTLSRTKTMFFDKLQQMQIDVIMLAGNHDTYFKNTNEVNSIALLLQEYRNISVIDSPKTITVGSDHQVCMIPWICAENEQECFEELKNTEASICCGHFEIEGFHMYRGSPSEEGIERKLFKKFMFTFSGHYHHKSNSDDIYYLGNPYELTWQDYDDPRGFHIFDLAKQELEFIPNPNKMFFRIVYDDKSESITQILNRDLTPYTSKYMKVVVVNKGNPFLFDQFMNKLYDVNPADITIVEDALDLTDALEDDTINEAEDTVTIINRYIDALENEGIDNNKLKNMMRELYVEALNLEQA